VNKKFRYADRLADADARQRLRDVHLLIGGTGAVGGETLIKMLRVYADLRRYHRSDPAGAGPVLVATGKDHDDAGDSLHELKRFRRRLFTLAEAEFGAKPSINGDTVRMPTGTLVVLREFSFSVLTELSEAIAGGDEALNCYLARLRQGADSLLAALRAEIRRERPLTGLLASVRAELEPSWPFANYRSVQFGIPIPSLLAYHLDGLRRLCELKFLGAEEANTLKEELIQRVGDELTEVRGQSDAVIVAHTTAVGGMYDVTKDGGQQIRLGFAHAANDAYLADKHRRAMESSQEYAKAGIWNLVTAAAIGIDDVRINRPLAMAKEMKLALQRVEEEPFPGAKRARYVHIHLPATVPLHAASHERLHFDRMSRGGELCPRLALRSGENGYLSAANAEALYRVMRVASPSELGAVLAIVGVLGDDPLAPWFPLGKDGKSRECYYRESDNSRLVFDFLSQPQVRATQLSGMEAQALVDLGSAKHQAELHALGLLILLHRLRTLDLDAIPAIVEPKQFDPVAFFESNSRPLSFEDIQEWDIADLESDLRTLVTADTTAGLSALKRFRAREQDRLAPKRAEARDLVFAAVLSAVRAVTSLGSPIVIDDAAGNPIVRCGWWIAPLSIVAEATDTVARWFEDRLAKLSAAGVEADLDDLVAHHLASSGFIDLRLHAIVTGSWTEQHHGGRVWRTTSEAGLRDVLQQLTPYQFFTSCGLLALLERLKGLADYFQAAQMELGTHFDGAWAMPRDEHGHTLVVPGIVEAFRMVSEGLEKATGTEILEGYWGYYPRGRLN
jgi:hypothetical protein